MWNKKLGLRVEHLSVYFFFFSTFDIFVLIGATDILDHHFIMHQLLLLNSIYPLLLSREIRS